MGRFVYSVIGKVCVENHGFLCYTGGRKSLTDLERNKTFMATMKEVARRAGVSVGTVSNVINGKTNNLEMIERVEAAVAELHFRPDQKARSLKGTSSYFVGVLVGSLLEPDVLSVISAIEEELHKKGYEMLVRSTGDNALIERKCVESLLRHGVDGLVVDTGSEKKGWIAGVEKKNCPVVCINARPEEKPYGSRIMISCEHALGDFFKWCKKNKHLHAGLLLNNRIITETRLRLLAESEGIRISCRMCGRGTKEEGFKAAQELMFETGHFELPSILMCGNYELYRGAYEAEEIFGEEHVCRYACIKKENWPEDQGRFECVVDLSYREAGEKAAQILLGQLGKKERFTAAAETVSASFKEEKKMYFKTPGKGKNKILRGAVLNSGSSELLVYVSEIFKRQYGFELEIERLSYRELLSLVSDEDRLKNEEVDFLMYDLVWKTELIHDGILKPLALKKTDEFCRDYVDNILESYGMHDDTLYGVPFLSGTQLLFYQRDLFYDETLKRQFRQKYGYELKAPETWEEFWDVCAFFTRSENKNSPLSFGTSFVNQGNVNSAIELLNFLWPLGSDVAVAGKPNLDDPMVSLALSHLKRTLRYTSGRPVSSWDDVAADFKEGDCAMVILYDSMALGINDPVRSKVSGNVESAVIPGKSPVLGGWGLGVFKGSKKAEEAERFVKWAGGSECDSIYSALSGMSNRKPFYLNRELDVLYPWKKNVLESYALSRERSAVEENREFYDKTLGELIEKSL